MQLHAGGERVIGLIATLYGLDKSKEIGLFQGLHYYLLSKGQIYSEVLLSEILLRRAQRPWAKRELGIL